MNIKKKKIGITNLPKTVLRRERKGVLMCIPSIKAKFVFRIKLFHWVHIYIHISIHIEKLGREEKKHYFDHILWIRVLHSPLPYPH